MINNKIMDTLPSTSTDFTLVEPKNENILFIVKCTRTSVWSE